MTKIRDKLFEDLQKIGVASSHHKGRFSSQEIDKCLSKSEKSSEVSLFLFHYDLITVMSIFVTVIVNFFSPMIIFGGFTFEEGTWLDVNTKEPSGTDLYIFNYIKT